jgi:predicted phage terminase large subunit-like protein
MTIHIPLNIPIFDELSRRSLRFFIGTAFNATHGERLACNPYIDAICHQMERVQRREINRLIVTLPPRHLKSFIVSVASPAWMLGHNPNEKIVVASYSQALAETHSTKFRTLIQSTDFQRIFPGLASRERMINNIAEQRFGREGFRFATSTEGTLTGRGGNILIIDDPNNAANIGSRAQRDGVIRWFNEVALSRLDNPSTGAIIIVQQRLHEDDLVGHLTQASDHGWTVLNIPAIAPEDTDYQIGNIPGRTTWHRRAGEVLDPRRVPREELERIRVLMGISAFAAQYQQQPTSDGGIIFHRDWLRYHEEPPRDERPVIVQSWDVAMEEEEQNDFSVCTTWQISGGLYYLLDVYRRRVELPELRDAARTLQRRYRPGTILIEDRGNGSGLRQDLRDLRSRGVRIERVNPREGKIMRARNVTGPVEAGYVNLPMSALWLETFVQEIVGFPNSRHDDQVDSMTQFLEWARRPSLEGLYNPISGRPYSSRQLRAMREARARENEDEDDE